MNQKKVRKKKRKGWLITAVAFLGVLFIAGGILFWQRSEAEASDGAVEIIAGEGEEIVYAQIDSIIGNELDTSVLTADMARTGETRSFEIPVGTDVITKLGVCTTFSRLSGGNNIAVLLEKGTDNILKVWVVS